MTRPPCRRTLARPETRRPSSSCIRGCGCRLADRILEGQKVSRGRQAAPVDDARAERGRRADAARLAGRAHHHPHDGDTRPVSTDPEVQGNLNVISGVDDGKPSTTPQNKHRRGFPGGCHTALCSRLCNKSGKKGSGRRDRSADTSCGREHLYRSSETWHQARKRLRLTLGELGEMKHCPRIKRLSCRNRNPT